MGNAMNQGEKSKSQIIMVASGKGGVGKSSLCASLAYHLARLGQRVLVVEMDNGLRCLDLMLGVAETIVFDSSDVLAGRCEPIKAIYQSPLHQNLFLLPATTQPEAGYDPQLFHKLCKGLANYYDCILIEAPPGFGSAVGDIALAATRALLVVTPDLICVRDAKVMSDYLDRKGLKQQHVVVNQVRMLRGRLEGLPNLDVVIDTVLEPLIGVVPFEPELIDLLTRGEALPPDTLAGQAMENIAHRLLGEYVPLAMR